MSRLEIRQIELGDLDRVEGLERECFGCGALPRLVLRQYYDLFARTTFVAIIEEKIVGCTIAGINAAPRDEGWLVSIAVAPDYRTYGLAGRLLRRVLEGLSALGVQRVSATTHPDNAAARALMGNAGFSETEEYPEYFGEGEPRVVLRWWRPDGGGENDAR